MTMAYGERPHFDAVDYGVRDDTERQGQMLAPSEQASLLALQAIGEVMHQAPENQRLSNYAVAYLREIIDGNPLVFVASDAPVIVNVLMALGGSSKEQEIPKQEAILRGFIASGKTRGEIGKELGATSNNVAIVLTRLRARALTRYGKKIPLHEFDVPLASHTLGPRATTFLSKILEGSLDDLSTDDAPLLAENIAILAGARTENMRQAVERVIAYDAMNADLVREMGLSWGAVRAILQTAPERIAQQYDAPMTLEVFNERAAMLRQAKEKTFAQPVLQDSPIGGTVRSGEAARSTELPQRMTREQAQAAIRILGGSVRLTRRSEVDSRYIHTVTKQLLEETFGADEEDARMKDMLTGYFMNNRKSGPLNELWALRDAIRELDERAHVLRASVPEIRSADDFAEYLYELHEEALKEAHEKSLEEARKRALEEARQTA